MKIDQILLKPKITEKALKMAKNSEYTFEINIKANKNQIKEVIEKIFKVEVDKIKTIIRKGKVRKFGRLSKKKRMPDVKLAYIKLKKGKIDLFPQT